MRTQVVEGPHHAVHSGQQQWAVRGFDSMDTVDWNLVNAAKHGIRHEPSDEKTTVQMNF
jgi:hypothetical protein